MRVYKFYDWDSMTDEDVEQSYEEYCDMIQTCCACCETVSFLINNSYSTLVRRLEKYRIAPPENIDLFPAKRYGTECDIRYYRICDEIKEILLQSATSMYQWLVGWGFCNPEDPAFYRKDGSVFLETIIHEGEITILHKEEDGDISHIVSCPHWMKAVDRRQFMLNIPPGCEIVIPDDFDGEIPIVLPEFSFLPES